MVEMIDPISSIMMLNSDDVIKKMQAKMNVTFFFGSMQFMIDDHLNMKWELLLWMIFFAQELNELITFNNRTILIHL